MTSLKTQPFFRTYPLTIWNKLTIISYILLSVWLWFYYHYTEYPSPDRLLGYIIGTQLVLIGFEYRAIRNLYMYLFWLVVGVGHATAAYLIKDVPLFQFPAGHISVTMANTLILVLLLQVLRFFSLKLQRSEFITPKDIHNERKVTWVDYVCTYAYMVVFFLGIVATPKRPVEKPKSEYIIYPQKDTLN